MKLKTHIEQPMFSKRLLCGIEWTKGTYYTWPINKEAFKYVDCRNCRKLWKEVETKRHLKVYMLGFDKWRKEREAT